MLEKKFKSIDLGVEITSYIDKQQVIWFKGKDVAEILGYSNTRNAICKYVESDDKKQLFTFHTTVPKTSTVDKNGNATVPKTSTVDKNGSMCTYINESGFYSLVLSSKLETAKKFKRWITSEVLPSIRKYGQYKMFDAPWNKMIMISNEKELHYKVVNLIRNYYPDAILVAAMRENQDTEEKRIDSWKKGFQRGTPDLMILNYHRDYKGLCIEFKSPTNNYKVSDSQIQMKDKYKKNYYAFILSNDYDSICKKIHKYMEGIRIPCEFCTKAFCNKNTLISHLRIFHRIAKTI